MTLANQIRQFAFQNYIAPARQSAQAQVVIRAGDVHEAMRLTSRMPAVCGSLGTNLFQQQYGIALIGRQGPNQGANVFFTFRV